MDKKDFKREKEGKDIIIPILSKIFTLFLVFTFVFMSTFEVSTDLVYSSEIHGNDVDMRELGLNEIEEQMKNDFKELYEKNKELIGMLNVPNVGYFPVMYSGDQKYISTNFNGEYEFKGLPFMNRNSFGRFDETTLIHAHTMRDGSMFTSLRNFRDEEFFQTNDPISVFDGKNFYYYKPFTVLNIQDGKEFIKQKGLDKEERVNYLQSLMNRSEVKMEDGMKPDFTKNALFLQTCDYNFYNSRLIVGSYLIYEKELDVDLRNATEEE